MHHHHHARFLGHVGDGDGVLQPHRHRFLNDRVGVVGGAYLSQHPVSLRGGHNVDDVWRDGRQQSGDVDEIGRSAGEARSGLRSLQLLVADAH